MKIDILDLLRADGSIIINKKLSHKIGVTENIILSELISKHKFYEKNGKLDEEGYFYYTIEKLKKDTALTRRIQVKAIKNLVKMGLIDKERKGIPAKRFFKINRDKILALFTNKIGKNNKSRPDKDVNPHGYQIAQNVQTRMNEKDKQDNTKSTNLHYNIKNNNKVSLSQKKVNSFISNYGITKNELEKMTDGLPFFEIINEKNIKDLFDEMNSKLREKIENGEIKNIKNYAKSTLNNFINEVLKPKYQEKRDEEEKEKKRKKKEQKKQDEIEKGKEIFNEMEEDTKQKIIENIPDIFRDSNIHFHIKIFKTIENCPEDTREVIYRWIYNQSNKSKDNLDGKTNFI